MRPNTGSLEREESKTDLSEEAKRERIAKLLQNIALGNLNSVAGQETASLPVDLWKIVTEYCWEPPSAFRCGITGTLLTDPVIVDHPDIEQVMYNRDALLKHINAGKFNILVTFSFSRRKTFIA